MAPETRKPPLTRWGAQRWQAVLGAGLVAGVVFGLMIQIVMGIMPKIGAIEGGTLPNIKPQSLVGHLVYGLVLGTVYPKLLDVVE